MNDGREGRPSSAGPLEPGRGPAGDTARATTTFSAWGHPAIRATHPASLELTAADHITARATCVVGVRAEVQPDDLRGYRGELTITLATGPHRAVIRATAHPGFRSGHRVVVRRSWYRSPDTFAVGADLGAGGLPRPLVAELVHPEARLLVRIEGWRTRSRGGRLQVIGLAEPSDPVVEEQAAEGRGAQEALRALERGENVRCRVTDVATGALARRLAAAALAAGAEVETAGLAPEMAALVLSGFAPEAPAWLARVDRAGFGLPHPPADAVCVWSLPERALGPLLEQIRARRGDGPALLVLDARRPCETSLRGNVGELGHQLPPARGRRCLVVLPPAPRAATPEARLLSELAAEGVPVATLARAAGRLGWSRRLVYGLLADGPGRWADTSAGVRADRGESPRKGAPQSRT